MTNKEIAQYFSQLAAIMELHKENQYKIRSYKNTYIQLRKLDSPLSEMSEEEISAIKGVGKATTSKILELIRTGELETYKTYLEKTPSGIVEMLGIKGFGPSKISVIWKELGCETVGELLYACNENRLVELKGFGQKTQQDLIQKINFYLNAQGKFLYAKLEPIVAEIIAHIQSLLPDAKVEITGEMRRKCPIVSQVKLLINQLDITQISSEKIHLLEQKEQEYHFLYLENLPFIVHTCSPSEWGSKQFRYTSPRPFIDEFLKQSPNTDFKNIATETEVFQKANLNYCEPELRDIPALIKREKIGLVKEKDVKGIIHAHSTYSDGIHSLEEMAQATKALGYQYLGITDHSKSAFYANGLKEERVYKQWEEIDKLNALDPDFTIYKGIESDILYNGNLDYDEEILKGFDFIIASVHSQLKMTQEKATQRLITAIENPYTTILGHPTGRLLLAREGYPIDTQKVIDACAANQVAIELNANPLRLDLDYKWIPYAMEKGVKIAINPDAHSTTGLHDVRYGVFAARKGGLTADALFCLNLMNC